MPENSLTSSEPKQEDNPAQNNKHSGKNFEFHTPRLDLSQGDPRDICLFIILSPILVPLFYIGAYLISFVLSCIVLFLKCLYVDICTVFSKNPCQLLKSPEFYLILSLIGVLALLTSNPVGWGMTALLISALIAAFIYTIISKCLIPPPVDQNTQNTTTTLVQQTIEATNEGVKQNP